MIIEILILISGIIVASCILAVGWAIGVYNYLQSGKININTQWSNVKAEYQRRWDLLLNLAQSVKSYKKHEKETLESVIKARSGIQFTGSKAAQIKNIGALEGLFSKLFALNESYPTLKSDIHHTKLMEETRITEDRINVARTDYNDVVREYNLIVMTFPSSIIAHLMRFNCEAMYTNEEVSNTAPRLELG